MSKDNKTVIYRTETRFNSSIQEDFLKVGGGHNRSMINGSIRCVKNIKNHGVHSNTSSWTKILHVHKNENCNANT